MKLMKICKGLYKTDNGYTIKANGGTNIFTGRPMAYQGWYTYDPQGNRYDFSITLKEAKDFLERNTR